MATKHEEITQVLEKAGEEDIEIVHLTDEMVIHIRTAPKQTPSEQKKCKWALVADKLATEDLLRALLEHHLQGCLAGVGNIDVLAEPLE